MSKIHNGAIFKSPSLSEFMVLYLCSGLDEWCLVAITPSFIGRDFMVPVIQSEEDGKWIFTGKELTAKLRKWKKLNKTIGFNVWGEG